MITPTIGRVVLYNDGASDQRVPAFIVYVFSDTRINIAGFDSDGVPFSAYTVRLCQDDEVCAVGQAEWMEYQKVQQDKSDDSNAKVSLAQPDPAAPSG